MAANDRVHWSIGVDSKSVVVGITAEQLMYREQLARALEQKGKTYTERREPACLEGLDSLSE